MDKPSSQEKTRAPKRTEDAKKPGTLYVVSTPIGNLGDISLRAIGTLKDADLIAAEDTRNTLKLLSHFDIHTPLTSYHEFNRFDKARELCLRLKAGEDIALVTDAGTPVISDPGEELIKVCIDENINVTAVPGPVSAINALVLSGFSADRFVFEGFLAPPKKKKERKAALRRLKNETGTIILFEAPHRLTDTLTELSGILGGERRIALCREMTKKHEEILRLTLGEAVDIKPRGEYVLVIEGRSDKEPDGGRKELFKDLSLAEHMEIYLSEGMSEKEALKAVAADRGVSRREIYNEIKR